MGKLDSRTLYSPTGMTAYLHGGFMCRSQNGNMMGSWWPLTPSGLAIDCITERASAEGWWQFLHNVILQSRPSSVDDTQYVCSQSDIPRDGALHAESS
jgi:hypothetical protein